MCRTFRRRARGFSLVAGIFLVLVLAALAAFILSVSGFQHTSSASDLQGTRAYHAARAGVEWGLFQVMDPANPNAAAAPACFASTPITLGGTLSGFAVTVNCQLATTTELTATRTISVYTITATGTAGTAGSPNYVDRQVQVTVSRCKDTALSPPNC